MKCSNCCEKEATVICKECSTVFCAECDQQVHSLSIFGGHSRTRTSTASIEACPDHGGRLKLLFCETCRCFCCSECVCAGQAHSAHRVTSYDRAYAARKTVFESRLAELRAMASVASTLEALLDHEAQAQTARAAAVQATITECFEHADAAAAKRKEALLADAEQRYAANSSTLAETLAEVRAAEEASHRALAAIKEPAAGFTESLSRIALVEQSAKALSGLSDQTLHKVIPESCSIKFCPTHGGSQVKREVEAKKEEAGRKDKDGCPKDKADSIVAAFEQFGSLSTASNNKDQFGSILKIKTVVSEDGKEVNDIGDTYARLTWAGVPALYLDRAAAGKLVFTLDMISEEEDNDKEEKEDSKHITTTTVYSGPATEYLCNDLVEHKVYTFVLRAQMLGGEYCYWASNRLVVMLGSYRGKWRTDCPNASVSPEAPLVATSKSGSRETVVADTPLVPGMVNRWRIRLVQSGGGWWEWVGVAPGDIDLKSRNNDTECGWYLNIENRTLSSGPPFKYRSKKYSGEGKIPMGSVVGLIMDMKRGTLSYTVNGVDMGVAYEGIPLDKPLFPAVVFNHSGQEVELLPWE